MTEDNIIKPLFDNTEAPEAARLRDAMKRACAPATERPRLVQCDAKGNVQAPAPGQTLNLTPFPDGVLFRCTPNSAKPGSFLIHDAAGLVVALAMTNEIADILCRGAHLFFVRAQEVIKAADEAAAIEVQPAERTAKEEEAEYEKQLVRLSPPAIPSRGPALPPLGIEGMPPLPPTRPHEVPSSGGIQYKLPLQDTD
jgi:hypothetical protein